MSSLDASSAPSHCGRDWSSDSSRSSLVAVSIDPVCLKLRTDPVRRSSYGELMTTTLENLLDLSDFAWGRLRARVQGLTDEEYIWEPFDGCWSVRTTGDGPA